MTRLADPTGASESPTDRLRALLGNTDVYLIGQILKGLFPLGTTILDAGCGEGRNMHWFLQNGYDVWGVDTSPEVILQLQNSFSSLAPRFIVAPVEQLSFESGFFDTVISSAVLHFARDERHFFQMLSEMLRVLKAGGHLFIRMATDIGIEKHVTLLQPGVYALPDGSTRFLFTRSLLTSVLTHFPVSLVDEFKSVNVSDVRSMCTLLLRKSTG